VAQRLQRQPDQSRHRAAPGDYSFVLYAESAGGHDESFHLVAVFGGDQGSPDISAAVPVNSGAFGVASAANGLGLLECDGPCNYVPNAGSLSFGDGALVATLIAFSGSPMPPRRLISSGRIITVKAMAAAATPTSSASPPCGSKR